MRGRIDFFWAARFDEFEVYTNTLTGWQNIWKICSVYPPPRIPVTNEGLGWDSLLKNTKNGIILVVTVTGWGVVPINMCALKDTTANFEVFFNECAFREDHGNIEGKFMKTLRL